MLFVYLSRLTPMISTITTTKITGLIISLLLFSVSTAFSQSNKQYVKLPDGTYYEAKPGQTALEAMIDARTYYPKAFGLEKLPDGKKMDAGWFNNCRLNAVKESKSDLATSQAVASCRELAVPKKCRAFPVNVDLLGNESGAERVKCVEACEAANYLSKSLGECSKG